MVHVLINLKQFQAGISVNAGQEGIKRFSSARKAVKPLIPKADIRIVCDGTAERAAIPVFDTLEGFGNRFRHIWIIRLDGFIIGFIRTPLCRLNGLQNGLCFVEHLAVTVLFFSGKLNIGRI